MDISIDLFTEADLEATDEIVMAAYNIAHSRKESLRRHLALQADGCFVVRQHDAIVGFGAAVDYGLFIYIALMSVPPAMQKRGIGRLLMEHLLTWAEIRSCPTVLLDASMAGVPLYKHFGFVEDDSTVVLQRSQSVPLSSLPSTRIVSVSSVSKEELAALVAFDTPFFGVERAGVLNSYWADNPERALVLRSGDGQITGYLMAQSRVLGPWVASTVEDAEQLLVHALGFSFESEPSIFVSASNSDALQLFNRYGFRQLRTLSHMRKGALVQRSRETYIYGQASLGFG